MAGVRVLSLFNQLISGNQVSDDELDVLKEWLSNYQTPSEWFCDPDIENLPVFEADQLVVEASKRYVELEKNGFLLCKLPNFKFSPKSYLYSFIFDGKRLNDSKWTPKDRYGHWADQVSVKARGYVNTTTIPGFTESDPLDLRTKEPVTFTKIADDAENQEKLPKFSATQDLRHFYTEFYNAHLSHKVIGPVPYLILACKDLVDKKKDRIPAISSFDFRKIENKLITLGFDKVAGFGYAYVYYFCHCSSAGDHDEDISTNSFNANYGPGTKLWRVVTRKYAHKLRDLNRKLKQLLTIRPDLVEICYLQHKGGYNKQNLLHPGWLSLYGIPYTVVMQHPGVGILTSSAALHSVVNHGRGLSVAINLIVPINFLMSPVTDLCTHTFEYEENEGILVEMKKLALRDVAVKPPLSTPPKVSEFDNIPNDESCGTRNYIVELLEEFDKLDPNENKLGYKYAFYALKRLMTLAGIEFKATTGIPHKITVKLNFVFSTKDLVEYDFPYPPTDLKKFVSLPVLIGTYDQFGEIRYVNGKVIPISNENEKPTVNVLKYGDNSICNINVLDRKEICRVIGDFVPSEEELVIGEKVAYFFENSVFRVGTFGGTTENEDNLFVVQVNGSELHMTINWLRVLKPLWYESLCTSIKRKMIPLCLPEIPKNLEICQPGPSQPQNPKKRTLDNKPNENSQKKRKYRDGELIEFTTKKVNNKMKFVCPVCENAYTTKQSLIDHFYGSHVDGFRALECCGRKFSYLRSYGVHKKTAHGEELPEDTWKPPTHKGNFIVIGGINE